MRHYCDGESCASGGLLRLVPIAGGRYFLRARGTVAGTSSDVTGSCLVGPDLVMEIWAPSAGALAGSVTPTTAWDVGVILRDHLCPLPGATVVCTDDEATGDIEEITIAANEGSQYLVILAVGAGGPFDLELMLTP